MIHRQNKTTRKIFAGFTTFFFIVNSLILPTGVSAQTFPASPLGGFNLPAPGTMLSTSPAFTPPIVSGLTLYPDNPLKFDFIIDRGDDNLQGEAFEEESKKLVNYFFAALTVPEEEMWVNLSPYEKDRIIADGLSATEMGRDMLIQDYLLKQLTASLMYPEEKIGEEFWKKVYAKAQAKLGTTEILPTSPESGLRPSANGSGSVGAINTFNKVWIVPDAASVYVNGNNVFVTQSHLKVMLEEDYVALRARDPGLVTRDSKVFPRHEASHQSLGEKQGNDTATDLIREFILPEIEKEINTGKNFANLRQIYNSMILATWYKKNLKETLLDKIYVDQNKVSGIDLEDKEIKEKIYTQYLAAFKKGVYNYIKEEHDPASGEMIPRKYFSGGLKGVDQAMISQRRPTPDQVARLAQRSYEKVAVEGKMRGNLGNRSAASPDAAMVTATSPAAKIVQALLNDQRFQKGLQYIEDPEYVDYFIGAQDVFNLGAVEHGHDYKRFKKTLLHNLDFLTESGYLDVSNTGHGYRLSFKAMFAENPDDIITTLNLVSRNPAEDRITGGYPSFAKREELEKIRKYQPHILDHQVAFSVQELEGVAGLLKTAEEAFQNAVNTEEDDSEIETSFHFQVHFLSPFFIRQQMNNVQYADLLRDSVARVAKIPKVRTVLERYSRQSNDPIVLLLQNALQLQEAPTFERSLAEAKKKARPFSVNLATLEERQDMSAEQKGKDLLAVWQKGNFAEVQEAHLRLLDELVRYTTAATGLKQEVEPILQKAVQSPNFKVRAFGLQSLLTLGLSATQMPVLPRDPLETDANAAKVRNAVERLLEINPRILDNPPEITTPSDVRYKREDDIRRSVDPRVNWFLELCSRNHIDTQEIRKFLINRDRLILNVIWLVLTIADHLYQQDQYQQDQSKTNLRNLYQATLGVVNRYVVLLGDDRSSQFSRRELYLRKQQIYRRLIAIDLAGKAIDDTIRYLLTSEAPSDVVFEAFLRLATARLAEHQGEINTRAYLLAVITHPGKTEQQVKVIWPILAKYGGQMTDEELRYFIEAIFYFRESYSGAYSYLAELTAALESGLRDRIFQLLMKILLTSSTVPEDSGFSKDYAHRLQVVQYALAGLVEQKKDNLIAQLKNLVTTEEQAERILGVFTAVEDKTKAADLLSQVAETERIPSKFAKMVAESLRGASLEKGLGQDEKTLRLTKSFATAQNHYDWDFSLEALKKLLSYAGQNPQRVPREAVPFLVNTVYVPGVNDFLKSSLKSDPQLSGVLNAELERLKALPPNIIGSYDIIRLYSLAELLGQSLSVEEEARKTLTHEHYRNAILRFLGEDNRGALLFVRESIRKKFFKIIESLVPYSSKDYVDHSLRSALGLGEDRDIQDISQLVKKIITPEGKQKIEAKYRTELGDRLLGLTNNSPPLRTSNVQRFFESLERIYPLPSALRFKLNLKSRSTAERDKLLTLAEAIEESRKIQSGSSGERLSVKFDRENFSVNLSDQAMMSSINAKGRTDVPETKQLAPNLDPIEYKYVDDSKLGTKRVKRPGDYYREWEEGVAVFPSAFIASTIKLFRDIRKLGELERNVANFRSLIEGTAVYLNTKQRTTEEEDILKYLQLMKTVFNKTGLTGSWEEQLNKARTMSELEHIQIQLKAEGEVKEILQRHKDLIQRFMPHFAGNNEAFQAAMEDSAKAQGFYGENAILAAYYRAFQLLAGITFPLSKPGTEPMKARDFPQEIAFGETISPERSLKLGLSFYRAVYQASTTALLQAEQEYLSDTGPENYAANLARIFKEDDPLLKQAITGTDDLDQFIAANKDALIAKLASEPFVGQTREEARLNIAMVPVIFFETGRPSGFTVLSLIAAMDGQIFQKVGDAKVKNFLSEKKQRGQGFTITGDEIPTLLKEAAANPEWVIDLFEGMADKNLAELTPVEKLYKALGMMLKKAQGYSQEAYALYKMLAASDFILKAEETVKARQRPSAREVMGTYGWTGPVIYVPAMPEVYAVLEEATRAQLDFLQKYFNTTLLSATPDAVSRQISGKLNQLEDLVSIFQGLKGATSRSAEQDPSKEQLVMISNKNLADKISQKWVKTGNLANAKPVAFPAMSLGIDDRDTGLKYQGEVMLMVGGARQGRAKTDRGYTARFAFYDVWRMVKTGGETVPTAEHTLKINDPNNADQYKTEAGIKKIYGAEFVERYNPLAQFVPDQAMMSLIPSGPLDPTKLRYRMPKQESPSSPGGIDFNANALNLKEQGEPLNFHFDNAMLQNIQPSAVQGILPVIINITPVTNFTFLLGLAEDTDKKDLSRL